MREYSGFLLKSAESSGELSHTVQGKAPKVSGSQLCQAACCLSRQKRLGGFQEAESLVLGPTVLLWVLALLRPAMQHLRNQKQPTSRADSMTRVIKTSRAYIWCSPPRLPSQLVEPSISGCHDLHPRNKYLSLTAWQPKYEPVSCSSCGVYVARFLHSIRWISSQESRDAPWSPVHWLENILCFSRNFRGIKISQKNILIQW